MSVDSFLNQLQLLIEGETRNINQRIQQQVSATLVSIGLIKNSLRHEQQQNATWINHIDEIALNVQRILDVSNETENALKVKKCFDITKSLKNIIGYIESLHSPDIQVIFDDSQAEYAFIYGIEQKVEQAIGCIMENSLKAMPKQGSIRVELKNGNSPPDDKQYVEINISDTGCGIPAYKRDFVFEFGTSYWADNKGSGLGLWFARSIVRSFDGDIRIKDSTVGKGTTFSIIFPTNNVNHKSNEHEKQGIEGGNVMITELLTVETIKAGIPFLINQLSKLTDRVNKEQLDKIQQKVQTAKTDQDIEDVKQIIQQNVPDAEQIASVEAFTAWVEEKVDASFDDLPGVSELVVRVLREKKKSESNALKKDRMLKMEAALKTEIEGFNEAVNIGDVGQREKRNLFERMTKALDFIKD